MNRKLDHTLMALSGTGLLLAFGLMFASPLKMPADPSAPLLAVAVAATSASLGDTASAPVRIGSPAVGGGSVQRTPRRSARTSLALPYFSFARGLRRGTGS